MDSRRFDALTQSLAAAKTRRGLLGSLAALGAGLLGTRATEAQVTQAQCGNVICKTNPGKCNDGCVCCVYSNGNSRCRPPGQCSPGSAVCPAGEEVDPILGCVPVERCAGAVLAGAGGPDSSFLVDDDLEVLVNGVSFFVDNDELANFIPPIALGPLANGDTVRVVASNSTLPQWCTVGGEFLDRITLYCPSTGASQVINPAAISQAAGGCGHVFFDQTVPVAL